MTVELFVSLGHNSSAMVAVDGVVRAGYEQERLDRVKASSAYPRESIEACLRAVGQDRADNAYVSHWFDRFKLESCKYINLDHLRGRATNVGSLSDDLTHHDAHARSALAFAHSQGVVSDAVVIVMDGFGNRQECFSAYSSRSGGAPRLTHRTYGYDHSLGLMYQYATDFLGLKQNQDEYKLLGYESRILEYVDAEPARRLRSWIREQAERHAFAMVEATRYPIVNLVGDALIDRGALDDARRRWHGFFGVWLDSLTAAGLDVGDPRALRTGIAYCAQSFLETAALRLIDETIGDRIDDRTTLVLTGGSFYNVKLNRAVARRFDVPVLCHPLAGDQGAAMGACQTPPSCPSLLLGHRLRLAGSGFGVSQLRWVDVVAEAVARGRIVNVVRGAMEYGPRALCNTTTFALPTRENVALINRLNARDDAMPMAPVMTEAAAMRYLDVRDVDLAGASARYMITTCAFKYSPPERLMGIAHPDPIDRELWTARPQVTTDPELVDLLRRFTDETLINTSFNYHGEPIVHTVDEAISTYERQWRRATGPEGVDLVVVP